MERKKKLGDSSGGHSLAETPEDFEHLLRTPLDPLLTDGARLKLLAALLGLPEGGGLGFSALRRLVDLTDGNLGSHLSVLAEAGYIKTTKVRSQRRGRSRSLYAATSEGKAAFESHVQALEAIIAASHGDPSGS